MELQRHSEEDHSLVFALRDGWCLRRVPLSNAKTVFDAVDLMERECTWYRKHLTERQVQISFFGLICFSAHTEPQLTFYGSAQSALLR